MTLAAHRREDANRAEGVEALLLSCDQQQRRRRLWRRAFVHDMCLLFAPLWDADFDRCVRCDAGFNVANHSISTALSLSFFPKNEDAAGEQHAGTHSAADGTGDCGRIVSGLLNRKHWQSWRRGRGGGRRRRRQRRGRPSYRGGWRRRRRRVRHQQQRGRARQWRLRRAG